MNNLIEEIENLTVSEIRESLHNMIYLYQETIGEFSPEVIEYFAILGNFEHVVDELNKNYKEYSQSDFVPKDISFRQYLGIDKKEGN